MRKTEIEKRTEKRIEKGIKIAKKTKIRRKKNRVVAVAKRSIDLVRVPKIELKRKKSDQDRVLKIANLTGIDHVLDQNDKIVIVARLTEKRTRRGAVTVETKKLSTLLNTNIGTSRPSDMSTLLRCNLKQCKARL